MKFWLRTIIDGRKISVKVNYKRQVKRVIEEWTGLYGLHFEYLDIRIETDEVKEVKAPVRLEPKSPPVDTKVVTIKDSINWPKSKSWLEKYGT